MSRGLAVGLLMVIAGCCLKFSNLPAGATYKVGDSITTSGTSISVEKFQWSGGDWTEDGSARIDTRGYAKGSGQDLNARNVNLRFRFDYPLKRITLKFGELGGNNNIRVNEEFKNAANLAELNGSTLGGVTATITGGQQGNNWYGTLQLNGKIDGFSIGGQELWLDDVCPKK
jgi:hypothetical protein